MPLLPDRASRASADGVQAFKYQAYEADGWGYQEWRLKASSVKDAVTLEGWYRPAETGEPGSGWLALLRPGRLQRGGHGPVADAVLAL